MVADGTYGQVNNYDNLKYQIACTDRDIPLLYKYERVDGFRGPKGHTFMDADREAGRISQESKKWKTISDKEDWIQIAKDTNNQRKSIIIECTSDLFLDWDRILEQWFVKRTTTKDGSKWTVLDYHWLNFGVGEVIDKNGVVMENGKPKLQYHPGACSVRSKMSFSFHS